MPGATDTERTLAIAVQDKLDGRVRPMLQVHGGDLSLISVTDGVVRVRFEGACVGCPLRPVTMAVVIEPALRLVDGARSVEAPGVHVSSGARARMAAMFGAAQPSSRVEQ
jgi:Fe-S cluster biogenesis protein NfuA